MKYPIGIQSFEKIRQNGYVYVDKTDLIYKLAKGSVYFLARPRRFGKSLLCSTLKCYFEGQRELFEGLKIMDLEQEWTTHPVITFDFNLVNKQRAEGLHDYIIGVIAKLEDSYGIIPAMDYKDGRAIPTPDVARRFDTLIAGLHQKTEQPVVVTVDEYDKPLLDLLDTDNPDDEQQLVANRELLKGFFSTFKAADRHLRF
ncbi:MAG: AAA family ATPase, partial [Prevotella sp.]